MLSFYVFQEISELKKKNSELNTDLDLCAAALAEKENKVMDLEETIAQMKSDPLSPAAESKSHNINWLLLCL
jgi:hypothetical protein